MDSAHVDKFIAEKLGKRLASRFSYLRILPIHFRMETRAQSVGLQSSYPLLVFDNEWLAAAASRTTGRKSGRETMGDDVKSIGIDDIVASAASGVLRAFEARRIGGDRLSVDRLVQSGFNVKFEIWAGGPWIRQLAELNPQPLPPVDGGGHLGQVSGGG